MRRGFTLVELLVVVAMIAVLAALLFPVFAQAKSASLRTACASQMRQLTLAQLMYVQDYDETIPNWYHWYGSRIVFWPSMFLPYVRDQRLYHCPATDRKREPDSDKLRLADYALFTWGPGGNGLSNDPYWRWAGNMKLGQVRRPSETFNLMDGYTLAEGYTRGFLPGFRQSWRHGPDGVNGGFLDGHSRWLTRYQTEKVDKDAQGWFFTFCAADR